MYNYYAACRAFARGGLSHANVRSSEPCQTGLTSACSLNVSQSLKFEQDPLVSREVVFNTVYITYSSLNS